MPTHSPINDPDFSSTGMVLAAGFGTRMRPLTLQKPKPLFEVGGRTMLDQTLDKLLAAGIKRAVVNCHYLADHIKTHLSQRKDMEIIISHETEILDTGGGIKNILHEFGNKPFFALNADIPWQDNGEAALLRLKRFWNPDKMDAALLLLPRQKALGFNGKGDFNLQETGQLSRKGAPFPRSHVWISAQILKPALFQNQTATTFSNNLIWDEAETAGRLYGLEHQGTCYHVGTPEDLAKANALLQNPQGWQV